jgi:hypothetical protein
VPLTDRVRIDIDGIVHAIFPVRFTSWPTEMVELRPTVGVRIIDGFTIFAGPTFNLAQDGHVPTRADISPYKAFVVDNLRLWPGATLGLEAF